MICHTGDAHQETSASVRRTRAGGCGGGVFGKSLYCGF